MNLPCPVTSWSASCPAPNGSTTLGTRKLISMLASGILMAALAMSAWKPAEDPYARLLGVWEYRQANSSRPSGFDNEGERLQFTRKGDVVQGLYFGLERDGDHGLSYSLVELKDISFAGDRISFVVPARAKHWRRPTRLGESGDAGFTRYELKYDGTITGEGLALRCSGPFGSCPAQQVLFRKGEWMPRGCSVAIAPGSHLQALSAPAALRDRLLSYRKGWQALCAGTPDRPSVEALLAEAREIRDAVEGEVANAISAIPIRALPGLRPGYVDALDVDDDEFREAALAKGTDVDRHFWKHYPKIAGPKLPTWIEATWDYGGCSRFGEYNWIAGLKALIELRAKPLGPTYGELRGWTEEALWQELEGSRDLCACGPTAAVVPDLEAIFRFVDQTPSLREHAPRLQARIKAITSGAVAVRSQKDAHCSGG